MSKACTRDVVFLRADQTMDEVRDSLKTHQGFPIVDANGDLIGIVTRQDFMSSSGQATLGSLIRRAPAVVYEDLSLRDAADHMVRENVGRLPVVKRDNPRKVIGILTRSDLLSAHARRLDEDVTESRIVRRSKAAAAKAGADRPFPV